MAPHRRWLLSLAILLAAYPARANDAQALAARIDHHIATRWTAAKVEPAPLADDAEFLRRVYLDLAGRIPSVAEARAFLKDQTPDKRQRLVEHLLKNPRYVTHFTNVWRAWMLPEATANFQVGYLTPGFETWLRKQLSQNVGYDQLVRELLMTPVTPEAMQNAYGYRGQGQPNPIAFFLAKEIKPENLAASTARLFLGVRLECAQCHNHPFATWKREQFWGQAAFFAGLQRQVQEGFAMPTKEIPDRRELAIPGTDRTVQAGFLDGSEPQWKYQVGARVTLADWLTAANNPYFARATVNRMWAYFFGTGLIEPVDEMAGGESTASHPELLDELARQFTAHKFDLKFLIRAITASRAYQLTSAEPGVRSQESGVRGQKFSRESQTSAEFARMAVRGLSPEQLFDSVVQAIGVPETAAGNPRVVFFGNNSARAEFLMKFAKQSDKTTEAQTSILQALALMNGKLIAEATKLENSETLAAVADSPFLDTRARIETLYLATLSRQPTPKELARLIRFVESGAGEDQETSSPADKEKHRNHALADVFWALLNSGEFILNH